MITENKFRGMGVALISPFDENDNIDFKSLRRLVQYLCEDGAADFIVVHGTTGESPCITRDERDEITKVVIDEVNGRIPIMVGLGGNNTKETCRRIAEMDAMGIDGILSVVPYYNKPTGEGMYRHFMSIAECSKLPIVLYNVPGRVGVNLSADIVQRLYQDSNNIIGIKEASGFPAQTESIRNLIDDENFVIYSGDDSLSVPIIRNGGAGVISVVANAYPKLFTRLIHLAMNGKYNEAEMIQLKLKDINSLLFANGNPSGIKALLYQMGLIDYNRLRLPLIPVSAEVYEGLEKAHEILSSQIDELMSIYNL